MDLTIVGPEVPLVLGITDLFTSRDLACFGPSRAAAQLEGSKAFTKAFLARHEGQRVFVFGFTFMVWQHFLQALEAQDLYLSLPGGVLLHGGGWKKLQDQAVDSAEFNRRLMARTGLDRVVNATTATITRITAAATATGTYWREVVPSPTPKP